jgi:HNH endonuclease
MRESLNDQERGVLALRFFGRLTVGGPAGECWIWNKEARSYGRLRHRGRMLSAHRVALLIASGEPIPDGLVVLHSCDHPQCVNPAHLRVDTLSENARDAFSKGRRTMAHADAVTRGRTAM